MQNAYFFQKYHFCNIYLTKSAKVYMHEVGKKNKVPLTCIIPNQKLGGTKLLNLPSVKIYKMYLPFLKKLTFVLGI